MRKLALRDEILLQIDKAARYIGGEVNAVMKNKDAVDIRFAMAFPDVYEIGMSNLGMMILYDMFNKRDDVWCERLFSPWTDLDKIMREEHIPLFTLESQDPVKEFDFLGITLGYEMCYTNVLQLLDLSGIPLLAKERTEDDPLESAEARVHTILSHLHRSLTFSISERVKWFMEPFLTLTRQTRRPVAADRISF